MQRDICFNCRRGFALSLLAVWLPILFVIAFAEAASFPGTSWPTASPASQGMDATILAQAKQQAQLGGGSGMIIRHGKVVMTWGSQTQRYDLKSSTKSLAGSTALGLADGDARIDVDDLASVYHDSLGNPPADNPQKWIQAITLHDLATHTAGFDKSGGYTQLLFAPGTKWSYSDGGPNWLAEVLTLIYHRDMSALLWERVFKPIGIPSAQLSWRLNAYRSTMLDGVIRREFGSGISASVNAMARIGYLYLNNGKWNTKQILPSLYVKDASSAQHPASLPEYRPKDYPGASSHYGLLWWTNDDGWLSGIPRDAFWSWGLGDSITLVIPSLDIVAVRAGKAWRAGGDVVAARFLPFFRPIVESVR